MTAALPPPGMFDIGVRPIVVTAVRLVASTVAVLLVYYLVPVQVEPDRSDIPYLILHIALFTVIAAVQVPAINRSRNPGLRAMEATVLTVVIYLVLYARIYLSASAADHAAFSEMLTQNTALYFTVTVFATVGFGDIVATTEPAQLLVTVQMLLNLVVFGVVIRGLFSVGKRGVEQRLSEQSPDPG